jgi:transposase
MIPVPSDVRIWIALGRTDMRKGMRGLALQVQQTLKRDPHAGDIYVFRGRAGSLVKILWHDGVGMSLYAKRLERGHRRWPACLKESTGETRRKAGVQPWLDRLLAMKKLRKTARF